MNKTCRRCGGEFVGHFNARFCGEACRLEHKRTYERAWKDAHKSPPKERAPIPPFPAGVVREVFGPWLTGFADGEATFGLGELRNPGRERSSFTAYFRVAVRDDDAETLRLIRSFWGCGSLNFADNARSKIANAKPVAIYSVQRVADLVSVVIPHFERYPLIAKKRFDFAVWRRGVELMAEVQARPLEYRPGHCPNRHGGTYPKWSAAEREVFRSLSAELSAQRGYRGSFGPGA